MMHFNDGNKWEVSSLKRATGSNSESSDVKRQQRNLSNIILRPTEARREQRNYPGLGDCTRDAEERFRW